MQCKHPAGFTNEKNRSNLHLDVKFKGWRQKAAQLVRKSDSALEILKWAASRVRESNHSPPIWKTINQYLRSKVISQDEKLGSGLLYDVMRVESHSGFPTINRTTNRLTVSSIPSVHRNAITRIDLLYRSR